MVDEDELPPEPELPVWVEPAWRCWDDLASERPYVSVGVSAPMGGTVITARPGSLPWRAIHEWCDRARCSDDDRDFIVPLVSALDRAFIADWSQRQGRGTAPQTLDDKVARWDAAAGR